MFKKSICGVLGIWLCGLALANASEQDPKWREKFGVNEKNFSSAGRSTYFILEPGYQLVFAGDEDNEHVELTITVLNETKTVDGVETRVVEERETHDGKLVEVSRNYFAIDPTGRDVYYFGEDVDIYKDGKITGHGGSWLSGVNGAKYGLAIPGSPKVGDRYYQEVAPKIAMDRAEIVGVTETVDTPAGTFHNCVKTEETTPLEPKSKEYKRYAPDIGLVQDGVLKLARHGRAK